jgi:hypothetical protein
MADMDKEKIMNVTDIAKSQLGYQEVGKTVCMASGMD